MFLAYNQGFPFLENVRKKRDEDRQLEEFFEALDGGFEDDFEDDEDDYEDDDFEDDFEDTEYGESFDSIEDALAYINSPLHEKAGELVPARRKKIKVVRGGKVVIKEPRTAYRKKRATPAQKRARLRNLKKTRTASAQRNRKKSNRIRQRRGL